MSRTTLLNAVRHLTDEEIAELFETAPVPQFEGGTRLCVECENPLAPESEHNLCRECRGQTTNL